MIKVEEFYTDMYEHLNTGLREKREKKHEVSEFLNSQDSAILIPRVIVGVMREAVEPVYSVGTSFMTEIRLESGTTIEFPSVGVLRAHRIREGQEYPEETLDFQRHRQPMDIRVEKIGLKIKVSEEAISDSQWDVIGLHVRQAGRAMARYKEEWCFREWSRHAHPVFDNSSTNADLHTTGLGPDGQPNNTLSVFDFIDGVTALMANGFIPTTIIMHPLTWTVFAKTELLNGLGHSPIPPGQNMLLPARSNITMGPDAISKQLPFSFEVLVTPFVPLNRINRTYDMYVIDRNNVGALIMRDELGSEEFTEPTRDLRSIKMRERYAPTTFYEGRGISVFKNLALAPSYPRPATFRLAQ